MSDHVHPESGICPDPERDWCGECDACTTWQNDHCAGCGRQWGYDLEELPS